MKNYSLIFACLAALSCAITHTAAIQQVDPYQQAQQLFNERQALLIKLFNLRYAGMQQVNARQAQTIARQLIILEPQLLALNAKILSNLVELLADLNTKIENEKIKGQNLSAQLQQFNKNAALFYKKYPNIRVDQIEKQALASAEQINILETQIKTINNQLQQLQYPENVYQFQLLDQANNDCGFRSARHAALADLLLQHKISPQQFFNALTKNENAVIDIAVLKSSLDESDKPLSGAKGNDFQTTPNQIKTMLQVIARSHPAMHPRNITILAPLLNFKQFVTDHPQDVPLFFPWLAIQDQEELAWTKNQNIRETIKNFRTQPNFSHIFIIDADQGKEPAPRVTHWLVIVLQKMDGQFNYTILDSLNKERLTLVKELQYLIEKAELPELPEEEKQ
jgi:hypothetical protein